MDAEWSDGAAAASPTTVSGGESKAGAAGGVSSADCPGSPPVSPAAPSTSPAATGTAAGRRRSANKRVVTVPLADVSGPRPKGVGEGNTPTDAWAWRKYGQKPIKGSPFPRAYYRCSSSKGCPARKQVERSRAEPDKVIVTYSFEHSHSDAMARAQNRQQAPKPKPAQPQPEPAESPSSGSHDVAATATVCAGAPAAATEAEASAAAVEVHDEFRWLYDGVSVTSSASPSDVEAADEMLYGAMFFGAPPAAAAPLPDEFVGDVGGLFDGEAGEEDAMFAGLGELPECAMVFRRHAGDGISVAGRVK